MATPGTLIEYYHSKKVMCALCMRTDNKDNVIVRNEENREDKVPRSKLLSQSQASASITPTHDPAEITQWLRQVAQRRDTLASSINLEETWELLVDDQASMELDELADLYFGKKPDAEQRSGLYRALDQDKIWFIRKNNVYLPRSRTLVQETLQRQRTEEERIQERGLVTVWLRQIWHGGTRGPSPAGGDRYLTWIREVAVLGNEASHFKEIQALFKELDITGKDAAFRVLVKAGIWSEDEFITLHRHHPPDEFAPELEAAAGLLEGVDRSQGRVDLTHLACITIDDSDTTEIDDALSLEVIEGGHRIGVHIADVTAVIAIGSELDREARERGTDIYLPERKMRMLPEALGDRACSLVAGKPRPAFSFLLEVDSLGQITSVQLARTLIQVRERLTYEQADKALANPAELPNWAPLLDICRLLRDQRSQAGAFTLPFGRVTIKVDTKVDPPDIRILPEDPNSVSQLIVSELMIQANRSAGEYCVEHGIPAIYRSQPAPEQALPKDSLTPEIIFKMRRYLRKGEVGLDPQRHSGLGLEAYVQATSPIRRFSDLLIQRQLSAHLAGQTLPYTRVDLEGLLIDVGRTASQAEQLERERKMYWTLRYLEQRRWQEFDAIVLGNFPDKHVIQLLPILFETDCPHVPGRPLPPGSRIRVRIDVVWPRQESVRVSPLLEEDDHAL